MEWALRWEQRGELDNEGREREIHSKTDTVSERQNRHEETVTGKDGGGSTSVTDIVQLTPFQSILYTWVSEVSVGRRMSTTPGFSLNLLHIYTMGIDQPLLWLSHRGLLQHSSQFRPEMILWITGREVEGRALDAGGKSPIDELLHT